MSALRRIGWLIGDRGYRNYVRERLLARLGYSFDFWGRVDCYLAWDRWLAALPLAELDLLEVSPGANSRWQGLGLRSYRGVQYPEFDLCAMTTGDNYDIVIADNVFEHLRHPCRAARNVHAMLKPGGQFLISTPFLVRVHAEPDDYTRWSEAGLKGLLEDCGFEPQWIETGAWGNRACVKANLDRWAYLGWGRDRTNEPDYPVTVWARARK
jgi:SAM-dependent methyltransferase